VKKLKLKARKAYNKRKLGQQNREDLKRILKQLLLVKKMHMRLLKIYNKCWAEFYKYAKRRKGNRENVPAIKDGNGRLITDSTEISIILWYSAVSVASRKCRALTQVSLSPLVLKSSGKR
jgi:hypothetical protein